MNGPEILTDYLTNKNTQNCAVVWVGIIALICATKLPAENFSNVVVEGGEYFQRQCMLVCFVNFIHLADVTRSTAHKCPLLYELAGEIRMASTDKLIFTSTKKESTKVV